MFEIAVDFTRNVLSPGTTSEMVGYSLLDFVGSLQFSAPQSACFFVEGENHLEHFFTVDEERNWLQSFVKLVLRLGKLWGVRQVRQLMQGGGHVADMPKGDVDCYAEIDEALDELACVDYASVLGLGELDVDGLK
ncbi:unnamed protein product [Lactuca virosa]|uniref:Uncharacterized protein n=1 Tax=Lactuca virosa TaxID=75947 RepID=A0AAU9LYT6_9ASTR|nr:unnamed protein product [Lactuca virosa]